MSSTILPVLPTVSRRVVVEGLEKSQDAGQVGQEEHLNEQPKLSTFSVIIDEDEPFSEFWKRIEGCESTFPLFNYYVDIE